ncbi:hypothetical protein M5E85_11060 [Roseburia intestinalis]|uniref:hypothetical protein n=1 Tax=Roseburia intestinalis TaxID=166486 RepID=UPI00201B747E|nr:hypothetical protein [Roseburia intestinalis]UQT29240.1 hypothetical protein M5E85_11060 [Roseburia intestinalis]
MAKYISALQRIEAMFQSAIEISKKYEIIMVTSNENHTDNTNDYSDNSVKSEFFSDQEQNLIRQTLENIGFKVKQFFNEEDFISFISNPRENLSKYIVLNSAQKGTKIGRKSLIPSLCDLYSVKYIGSNPYIVSLCRDKYRTSCILKQHGISTPQAWLYDARYGWLNGSPENFKYPLIIKPNYESSSIGIDENNIGYYDSHFFYKVKEMSSCYRQEILLEEFIEGFEAETPVISCKDSLGFFPVGINLDFEPYMGDRILNYNNRSIDNYTFFDFSEKFPELSHELLKTAYKVIKLLSIIGFGRVDFRIKSNKMFYITDISTNPHYTLKSSYHFIFEQLGLDYKYLIACLIASSF